MQALKLGASLYVPAIHTDLVNIAKGVKFPQLKSLIIDTEDAISPDDLPFAYHNIKKLLASLDDSEKENLPMVFIRVRNPEELKRVNEFAGIKNINGFALPKFTTENMDDYMLNIVPDKFYMPILEKDIFFAKNLEEIRDFILEYRNRIISLRIGATDLLSNFGLRRDNNYTIYQVAVINQVIANIVSTFKPFGFNITAPVWECFSETSRDKLEEEVRLDLLNGLFGKSVIHPWQIDIVQNIYQVSHEDYETAIKLLDPYSPYVFKFYDRMNEKATHTNWAENIVALAEIYGIKEHPLEKKITFNKGDKGY